jgi:sodium/proline symporter
LNDELAAGLDPEMALPKLASELLPGVLVGVILGGLFAATLSTADTQLLCSSAALTQDLVPWWGRTYGGAKLGFVLVACAAALMAIFAQESVFDIVVLSWSVLAAVIGPLLAVQALRWPVSNLVGVLMMLGGLATALLWRYALRLSDSMYEVLPGMLAGFAVYGLARLAARQAAGAGAEAGRA